MQGRAVLGMGYPPMVAFLSAISALSAPSLGARSSDAADLAAAVGITNFSYVHSPDTKSSPSREVGDIKFSVTNLSSQPIVGFLVVINATYRDGSTRPYAARRQNFSGEAHMKGKILARSGRAPGAQEFLPRGRIVQWSVRSSASQDWGDASLCRSSRRQCYRRPQPRAQGVFRAEPCDGD